MNLIRLDSSPNPNPDEFPNHLSQELHHFREMPGEILPEESKVRISFPRFGRGEQRQSDFAVDVDWLDVRRLVTQFIEMKHPEATNLERVLRLVSQIEKAGWYNSDLPEDFWEILP